MKEKGSGINPTPTLNGKRHSIKVQYTNKDAKERLFEFIKKQGPDVAVHELAVDYYAENQEFTDGFKVYSVVHVLEDIIKHILKQLRPKPSEQFELPFEVQELGGLPQYVPYIAESGQPRHVIAGEAEWFHLNSWRDMDNRGFRTRSKGNTRVNRIVSFFEPFMKGSKLKVRHVCDSIANKKPQ